MSRKDFSMIEAEGRFRTDENLHLVITDSGLGGLSVCAEIERNLRLAGPSRHNRLTYFNAWPDPRRGYNELPDMQARAQAFNRALLRMDQFKPDRILLACNTLSILYSLTEYSRTAGIPVSGIIDAGVDLFFESLRADPQSSMVLIGTRTTIGSRVHLDSLVRRGIQRERITSIACHGLASAIEKDPDSPAVAGLVDKFLSELRGECQSGARLYAGFCCTHYGYIKELILSTLERHSGKEVHILDPNHRLANWVAPVEGEIAAGQARSTVEVEVISQVELEETSRRALARRLESVSEVTARALLSYTHAPGLF